MRHVLCGNWKILTLVSITSERLHGRILIAGIMRGLAGNMQNLNKEDYFMKQISTPNAPAAIGPYSQGFVVNGLLYTSGQIALDPATGEVVAGSRAICPEV